MRLTTLSSCIVPRIRTALVSTSQEDLAVRSRMSAHSSVAISTIVQPSQSMLEALPLELRATIFLALHDISDLYALIRSSPLLNAVFASQRHLILFTLLLRDMGPDIFTEALYLQKASEVPSFTSSEGDEKGSIETFLDEYKSREVNPETLTCLSFGPTSIAALARLHFVLRTASSDFCQSNLSVHPTGAREESYEALSSTEKSRIYRALYRFELFHIIFKRLPRVDPLTHDIIGFHGHPWDERFSIVDMSFVFFPIFKPWEVEEIACICDHLLNRYGRSLYFLELGLTWFHRFVNKDPSVVRQQSRPTTASFALVPGTISDALSCEPFDYLFPTATNNEFVNHKALHFQADSLNKCNAAWPWSTGCKVEVFYDQYHNLFLRGWGYVFWDCERLNGWKVLDKPRSALCDRGPCYCDG